MEPPSLWRCGPNERTTGRTWHNVVVTRAVPTLVDVPDTLWVRHRGRLHRLPLCPDLRPYTTVALMPSANGGPVTVHVLSDGTCFTVTGSGLSEADAMFCEELEDSPLPECRCEKFVHRPVVLDGVDE